MQEALLSPGPPPAGFSWHREDDAATSVLVPDGWFVRSENRNQVAALFVTQEAIRAGGEFRTGLSLNYFPGFSQRYGLKPTEQGLLMTAQLCQRPDNQILLSTSQSSPAGVGSIVRFRTASPDPRIVHQLCVADDSGDTFRWIAFESPESTWSDAWKFGEPMLKQLFLWKGVMVPNARALH